jgi:prepilin-type N-terminal cleavage/methylation domain-containing protein
MHGRRGFTLIELLVVIAIIGSWLDRSLSIRSSAVLTAA